MKLINKREKLNSGKILYSNPIDTKEFKCINIDIVSSDDNCNKCRLDEIIEIPKDCKEFFIKEAGECKYCGGKKSQIIFK